MNEKNASDLGLDLLEKKPLSKETRAILESSIPFLVKMYYDANYEVVPVHPLLMPGETLEQMRKDGVCY